MANSEYNNFNIEKAYKSALKYAQSHYENFPVVSRFLPKSIRKHIAVVYQFARQADDLADEGVLPTSERIKKLEEYEQQLNDSLNNKSINEFWVSLAETVKCKNLTVKHFKDLLSAFKQDVVKQRYNNFEEILDYCERSANPVGRIILELFDIRDPEIVGYSDSICTALQLTNFYQDVSVDIIKGRFYLPIDEMDQFGISENMFEKKEDNTNFQQLIKYQTDRTKKLFENGKKILRYLPWNLKFQIKLTILGGTRILKKIEKIKYNTLKQRPVLTKYDYLIIFLKLILN